MDDLTIRVPSSIYEPIRVQWGEGESITEPLGVTELKELLGMVLRARFIEKRKHGDEVNFYGATDTDSPHG